MARPGDAGRLVVTGTVDDIRSVVAGISDPEIPVLTVDDLGIVRDVSVQDGTFVVTITPTYSGCPALQAIQEDMAAALTAAGYDDVEIRTVYSPAWTTEWLSDEGRRKLLEFGIAPPHPVGLLVRPDVLCPRCREKARTVAEFGSTACKALMVCTRCGEPFDYFKEL